MNKKEILIIIAVLIFGAIYQLTTEGRVLFLRRCSDNPEKLTQTGKYIKFRNPERRFSGAEGLEIINPAGGIIINPSSSPDIILKSEILVYNTSKQKSQTVFDNIKIDSGISSHILKIQLSKHSKFSPHQVRIRYELLVPETTNIKINNNYGNIDIRNLSSNINITQKYGRIRLEDINGEIECKGYKIHLINIKTARAVNLQIKSSNALITDCQRAIIFGKHCRLKLKWIEEYTYIENTYKSISMANSQGTIKIRSKASEIDLQSINADSMLINNSYKDIKISKLKARSVSFLISHNDLYLSFSQVLKSISIRGENSNIYLKYPKTSKASLLLDNKYGNIYNKRSKKNGYLTQEYKTLLSKKQNFPQIIITNTYGNITLENL